MCISIICTYKTFFITVEIRNIHIVKLKTKAGMFMLLLSL